MIHQLDPEVLKEASHQYYDVYETAPFPIENTQHEKYSNVTDYLYTLNNLYIAESPYYKTMRPIPEEYELMNDDGEFENGDERIGISSLERLEDLHSEESQDEMDEGAEIHAIQSVNNQGKYSVL